MPDNLPRTSTDTNDPLAKLDSSHDLSKLSSSSLAYVEDLYLDYLNDPTSVDEQWQTAFAEIPKNGFSSHALQLGPSFEGYSLFNPPAVQATEIADADSELQYKVGMLIRNFRVRGHIIADLDPLGLADKKIPEELTLDYYGFTQADLARTIRSGTMAGKTLQEAHERLKETYCRSIGVQFMHIDDFEARQWLRDEMEESLNRIELNHDEQIRILEKLTEAVVFEEFIQTKYVGVKSFSLTGGESLIPLLDLAVEHASEQGVQEVVFGMAHRGRLNVLANICGKPERQIFREFDDADAESYIGRGDVKYHMGYSNDIKTENGKEVHVSLCFNPSHLEYVNPVVMGRVRAKQDRLADEKREAVLGVLIHGDAAFIGEGVVQESLNMSELQAYKVGGMLHVVLNNQIGFTTGPSQGRSSPYATDIAKMLQSPIFHVNGEDPEAVAKVTRLAMEFRHKFKRDVVIDLYCYRKFGHNESDEPAFTQPIMYGTIKKQKSVQDGYMERLEQIGGITHDEAVAIELAKKERLEQELAAARSPSYKLSYQAYEGIWKDYKGGADANTPEVSTAVDIDILSLLGQRLVHLPNNFTPNSKIKRLLGQRQEMYQATRPLDWGSAEALAFASLANEQHQVRMTGQDVERGTFSHRHAVLHDAKTNELYIPLQHLYAEQASVEIHNSSLSENSVLGFEYGYSLDWPEGITIWEAQFGDFANSGQVIFDQFISSGEDKWRRLSALVVLLPHGFEGAGPEHSSARLERFLMLCAEDNMQVMNLSTPANYYHAIRRQVKRPWRKPLIIMSPKSLLRLPEATSELDELANGEFQKVIADTVEATDSIKRILLCSGKVYYELIAKREVEERNDIAIIRVEQLYPMPEAEITAALSSYSKETPVYWVQEEPKNMGAWFYMRVHFAEGISAHKLSGITRPESASPATGSGNSHKIEQRSLLERAFND